MTFLRSSGDRGPAPPGRSRRRGGRSVSKTRPVPRPRASETPPPRSSNSSQSSARRGRWNQIAWSRLAVKTRSQSGMSGWAPSAAASGNSSERYANAHACNAGSSPRSSRHAHPRRARTARGRRVAKRCAGRRAAASVRRASSRAAERRPARRPRRSRSPASGAWKLAMRFRIAPPPWYATTWRVANEPAVAHAVHFVEHGLVLVTGPDEVRVQRLRAAVRRSTVRPAARNACATTCPPYSRPHPSGGPPPRIRVGLDGLEFEQRTKIGDRMDRDHGRQRGTAPRTCVTQALSGA